MHAANPSVIIWYPVIMLHSCYPLTLLLLIGGKSAKLDAAILLKYIVTPNHTTTFLPSICNSTQLHSLLKMTAQ